MPDKHAHTNGFRQRCFEARLFWERRNGRRLTQEMLVELYRKASGRKITQSTISDWINAVTIPSLEDVEYLAKAFGGIDPGWLAFGEAKAPRPRPRSGP
jgi:transcriptional regulator with XRE-family HTH domain